MPLLTVCLDSNVIVSGIAFGGKPSEILQRALAKKFRLVLGPPILEEVERNLIVKIGARKSLVDPVLQDLLDVASLYAPTEVHEVTANKGDNLVLAICLLGECDVLVTGDRKHLLPLSTYKGIIIESPSNFLTRLDQERSEK